MWILTIIKPRFRKKFFPEYLLKHSGKNEFLSIDVFATSDSFGKRNMNKKLSSERISLLKRFINKIFPKISVATFYPDESKQYSSMGIVRIKLIDKNSKLAARLALDKKKLSLFANSGDNNFAFLGSGGYSSAMIDNSEFTGYNLSLKFLFPFAKDYDFFYGFGARYENISSNTNSKNITNADINFNSFQAGFDLAYFFKTSWMDFVLNPFVYSGIYNSYVRTITQADGTTITVSPNILNHINLGASMHFLFKISNFYFGPGASYSTTYLNFTDYKDDNGRSYNGISDFYKTLNINLTLGGFL